MSDMKGVYIGYLGYETHRKVYGGDGKSKVYVDIGKIDIGDHEDGVNPMSPKLDCHHRDKFLHRICIEYLCA